MLYDILETPAVLIELDQVEKNIRDMIRENRRYGIAVRPHIKPHKSCELARLQLEAGCSGITCAKLGEAEVMADGGITDILIAFPLIGSAKMARLDSLLDRAAITTIVNSPEGASQLSSLGSSRASPIHVLLEIDGGIRRGGLNPGAEALAFARSIEHLPGLAMIGIMYYSGIIYAEKTPEGFARATQKERDDIVQTADLLREAGFRMDVLSGGSSYSAKLPHLLQGITEVRPGHYIFNDAGQLSSGFASEDQCALRVISTVVSQVDRHHAIIDAGSKTLTTDLCASRPGYGYVLGRPDIQIHKLNEEHGFIVSEQPLNLAIGDKIAIIPNHACVIPNLADEIYGIRDQRVDRLIRIDARGKNR